METITVTKARKNLYRLVDKTEQSSQPVLITGKRNNAVLVSEKDWSSIQETLYLLNIKGMRESIIDGLKTPIDECSEKLDW